MIGRGLAGLVLVTVLASPARADRPVKNENVSFGLAAGGTALSSGLVFAAFLARPDGDDYSKPLLLSGIATSIVTPSLGHLYSGQYLTLGMGIRGIAGLLAVWGFSMKQDEPCITIPNQNCPSTTGTGLTLISLAAIAYIGGVAWDVQDAKAAARRHNKKYSMTFSPTAMSHGGGLSVVGRF